MMPPTTTEPQITTSTTQTKSKPKPKPKSKSNKTTRSIQSSWSYIALLPTSTASSSSSNKAGAGDELDHPTLLLRLQAALKSHLGISGLAIPLDVLSLPRHDSHSEESDEKGRQEKTILIRVPREDAARFCAAVGGWVGTESGGKGGEKVGFVIIATAEWLPALRSVSGLKSLFEA